MIKVFWQGGWKDVDIYWDINNEADLKKKKNGSWYMVINAYIDIIK